MSESLRTARCRIEVAEWVAEEFELPASGIVSLTKEPNREDWFATVLPDLDYELKGGTWDEPIWAWTRHPWFVALGLTDEECVASLQGVAE